MAAHVHAHHQQVAGDTRRVTWWGLIANLVLSAGKLVAGVLGNSHALAADGIHSLSDCFSDVAILVGSCFWSQPPDECHPYGHRRIETLVTLGVGAAVGAVGLFLLWDAVVALKEAEHSSPKLIAGATALIAIVAKEVLFRWTLREGLRLRSPALRANAWHHRSDAISSIPVLIAIGGAMLSPDWWFLDQVGAVVVSGFILKAAFDIVKPGLHELIDSGASPEARASIRRIASETPGVRGVHDLRTRYVGSDIHTDLHVEVGEEITVREGHRIGNHVAQRIRELSPDVVDVLVHIDPYDDRPQQAKPEQEQRDSHPEQHAARVLADPENKPGR